MSPRMDHCAFCIAKRLAEHGGGEHGPFDGMAGLERVVTHVKGIPVCPSHIRQALAVGDLVAVHDAALQIIEFWRLSPDNPKQAIVPVDLVRQLSRAVTSVGVEGEAV